MQNADYSFSGHNVSWAAENTTIFSRDDGNKDSLVISDSSGKPSKGLPGTHLTVTALPTKSKGANEYVFYQTDSSNITEFVRDINSGTGWFTSSVTIPNAWLNIYTYMKRAGVGKGRVGVWPRWSTFFFFFSLWEKDNFHIYNTMNKKKAFFFGWNFQWSTA